MNWQEKLSSLLTAQTDNRETQEPTATEIVLEFMREEVHPRLKAAQVNFIESNKFVESRLEATVSPELPEGITFDAISTCLSIQTAMRGDAYKYSLLFERQTGFYIDIKFDRINGDQVLGSFALDREPESPTIFIESYLKDFREQFS